MADLSLDTSSADSSTGGAYNDYQDNQHTAEDLLNLEQYDPRVAANQFKQDAATYGNTNQSGQTPSLLGQMVKNVPKSLKKAMEEPPGSNPYASVMGNGAFGISGGFARQATIGNFEKGHMYVPTEQTKPPSRAREMPTENPNEVYRRWYEDMRTFAYSGK